MASGVPNNDSAVLIAGVGMTPFGNHLTRSLKSLAAEAIAAALGDAGIDSSQLQAAYMANAVAGEMTGQSCIAGQVILRAMGVGKIPVINVENACASASTAFYQACAMVSSGAYDVVLACGVEKLFHDDKQKSLAAFNGSADVDLYAGNRASSEKHSLFMGIYAGMARDYMEQYGITIEQLAEVVVKNSYHGSLNPQAQFRELLTLQQVVAAREIVYPLTLPMCSPIADGAAAVILVSAAKARQLGISQPVTVLATQLRSGWDYGAAEPESLTEFTARCAYEQAGLGPKDLSCVEVHDATAPAELMLYEQLGLCAKGDGGEFVSGGHTRLGGQLPVNTAGGLLRRGHPIGATGIAQLIELTLQLRGQAGKRQVPSARFAMAENGGGYIGEDLATVTVSILSAPG